MGKVGSEEGTFQGGEVSQRAGPDVEKEAQCESAGTGGRKGPEEENGQEGRKVRCSRKTWTPTPGI